MSKDSKLYNILIWLVSILVPLVDDSSKLLSKHCFKSASVARTVWVTATALALDYFYYFDLEG